MNTKRKQVTDYQKACGHRDHLTLQYLELRAQERYSGHTRRYSARYRTVQWPIDLIPLHFCTCFTHLFCVEKELIRFISELFKGRYHRGLQQQAVRMPIQLMPEELNLWRQKHSEYAKIPRRPRFGNSWNRSKQVRAVLTVQKLGKSILVKGEPAKSNLNATTT